MSRKPAILAIDQGTTSSRAIVFSTEAEIVSVAQKELPQHFPHDGWVEHDAMDIWHDTVAVCGEAIASARDKNYAVQCIGITNQRETTVLWNRETGQPLHKAIVWQDRRTADKCAEIKQAGHEKAVTEKTGLLLDPYFSATKIAWLLDHLDGARQAANAGKLAAGTIDSWLLWNLTGGAHLTDATNASRTALFNIHSQAWDDDLLDLFGIPASLLPEVVDNHGAFGTTDLFGDPLPITGMAGDQQAASIGQACFEPGMIKSTYGTGCFVLLNTGADAIASSNKLLTTTAYRLGGRATYALEGSIFVAGAGVQWLRDQIGLFTSSPESEAIAAALPDNGGVYMVPAFTGLGAPHWDPNARGAIFGLTRDSTAAHLTRAVLEAAAYQTKDLLDAMRQDWQGGISELRVDGGMANNDWLMQFLADIGGRTVRRPRITETTALGAAFLAGLEVGMWSSLEEISSQWKEDRVFDRAMQDGMRDDLLAGWHRAVARTLSGMEG